MWPTDSLTILFVCQSCGGGFSQVDHFLDHKKEKHWSELQNTTCIIFEERSTHSSNNNSNGLLPLVPVLVKEEQQIQLKDDSPDLMETSTVTIKVEQTNDCCVENEDSNNIDFDGAQNFDLIKKPSSLAPLDEINVGLLEPKSELIIFDEPKKPPIPIRPNPYVRLKRLTFQEICKSMKSRFFSSSFHVSPPLKTLDCLSNSISTNSNNSLPSASTSVSDRIADATDRCIISQNNLNLDTSKDTSDAINISRNDFQCNLCSKTCNSNPELRIHVGICTLYHHHRDRYCVPCNRKFRKPFEFRKHSKRQHGKEIVATSARSSKDPEIRPEFKCLRCQQYFRESWELAKHVNVVHTPPVAAEKTFKCHLCGEDYSAKISFSSHLESCRHLNGSASVSSGRIN